MMRRIIRIIMSSVFAQVAEIVNQGNLLPDQYVLQV